MKKQLHPHLETRGINTNQKLLPAKIVASRAIILEENSGRVCSFGWHLAPRKGWIEMRGETTALHSALKAGGARAILKAASF